MDKTLLKRNLSWLLSMVDNKTRLIEEMEKILDELYEDKRRIIYVESNKPE